MCLVFLSLLCPRYDSNGPSQPFKSLLLKTHSTIWLDLMVCSKSHLSWWTVSLFARSHAWRLTKNGKWTHYVPDFSISAPNSDILYSKLTSYCPMLVCSFCLSKSSFCSISNSFQDEVRQRRRLEIPCLLLLFKSRTWPWHVLPSSKMIFTVRTCSFWSPKLIWHTRGTVTKLPTRTDMRLVSLFLRLPATLSVKYRAT